MNEDDSEQIASLLMQMGYSPTDAPQEADVAVLVTCSVREKPEQKAKSKLGELRLLKLENPGMIIVVAGCMAQRVGESIRRGRPYVDIVLGTGNVASLPGLIREVVERPMFRDLKSRNTDLLSALDLPQDKTGLLPTPTRVARPDTALKSFVPVMYGCDNYCAYCVVPYVRGRERSRTVEDIVSEVESLTSHGRKEITLLGQNVNSYGLSLDPLTDFSELLRAVNDVHGIERIRFTTSHPKDLSDRLIASMRDMPKVCRHLHLPVQSGDDEILRRMNRKYTSAHYQERVASLRAALPDIAITTDFLVGFPGETEEQFENTLKLAETMRFDAAYMFAYNEIPDTAAAQMPDKLSFEVKNSRLHKLIDIQNRITGEINNSLIGQEFKVLVEGVSPKDLNRLTGLTSQNKTVNFAATADMFRDLGLMKLAGSVQTKSRNIKNKTVNFTGTAELVGRLVTVRVTRGRMYGFEAELVEDSVCTAARRV